MPAIRSRMSSSSSTMRISDAINDPFLLIFQSFFTLFRRAGSFGYLLCEGETQGDFGALAPFGIGKNDLPAMVFHDLAHNRQTQAGALGARRDIGLGPAVTVFR